MMAPQLTERDNFFWLLIALVLVLLCDAIVSQLQLRHGQLLVNISLIVILFTAVWSLDRDQRGWHNWKHGMTLVIAGLLVANTYIESKILSVATMGGCFVFLTLSIHLIWRQVLFTGAVDTNKIIGAVCIYILLGLVWAFGYLIAEEMFPGSFTGLHDKVWQSNLDQFTYYSMVTLTTMGYGDITPEQPVAQFLAYMEGITGIFYTTVLVASLIGVRLADNPRHPIASSKPEP
jgi:voltage-gated potassium channel